MSSALCCHSSKCFSTKSREKLEGEYRTNVELELIEHKRSYLNGPASQQAQNKFILLFGIFQLSYPTLASFSVTRKKLPNVYQSCPKNDFTRQMKDLDNFTKIAPKCGRFVQIIDASGFKKLPKCNKSSNLVTLTSFHRPERIRRKQSWIIYKQ